jgi:hypothetical protein
MQEHRFIFSEAAEPGLYDGSRPCQPGMPVSNDPVPLLSPGVKPVIHQGEILTAVVDFDVVQTCEPPGAHGHQVFGPSIPYLGQVLGQVDRRIGIVTNPEQEDLPVELIDAPDRTIQAVGDVRGMSGCNFPSLGTRCGEGVRTVTPENAGQAPERVRYDTHAQAWSPRRIEWMIVIVTHAGHDQCSGRPQCAPQRFDKAQRAAFHRRQLRERRVYDQDTTGLYPELLELG